MRLDEVDPALDAIDGVVEAVVRPVVEPFLHALLLAQVPAGRLCRACGVNALTTRSGLRKEIDEFPCRCTRNAVAPTLLSEPAVEWGRSAAWLRRPGAGVPQALSDRRLGP